MPVFTLGGAVFVTGTGYIDFEEFCKIVRRKMQEDEDERELREIFRVLDKDKKGEVNVCELRYTMQHCTHQHL